MSRHRLTIAAAAATLLASIALYSVVAGSSWFWASAGAVVLVALAGAGTQAARRVIPAVACLAAALAVLLLYVNILFAGAQSGARVIPTGASLHHLWRLAGRGLAETSRFAPPVPPRPGVLLLTVAGIGIIAALTDLLAVRLRRPALAGLPLLALFCVPETTSSKPSAAGTALVFILAMAGYLALLAADGRERVRLWGRLVSAWQSGRPYTRLDTSQLAASGRRVGMAAVVLALLVPLLVPSLRPHRLFGGSSLGGSGGGGGGPIQLPDPLAQLNQQLRRSHQEVVLTYTTADPVPPYLQVYVLDELSDNAWTMTTPTSGSTAPLASRLPPAPGLNQRTPGTLVREDISLGQRLAPAGGGISYLPVPYPAQAVRVHGNWRVDHNSLTVLAPGAGLSGLRYQVTAKEVNPSQQLLRSAAGPSASLASSLTVPRDFQGLRKLADRITAGRTTPYGQAVALQEWFTRPGNFTYSLSVPQPRSANALIQFLTKDKRGYCQQFAFAMAVLARLLGIPARVAVGYTQGVSVGHNRWQVGTNDAHAWPELFFQGAGWLRFEPTPGGTEGVGQPTASAPNYSFGGPAASAGSSQPTAPATPAGASANASCPPGSPGCAGQIGNRIRRLPGQSAGGGTGRHGSGSFPVGWLVAGLAALLLVSPGAARALTRRRRWLRASGDAGRANAAWLELRDDLADYRITPRPSESPRALAGRLTGPLGLAPADQAALQRVADAAERAAYAPRPAAGVSLRADSATIRRAIARSAGWQARWQAWLLPASVLTLVRLALQEVLDVFGWLDRVTIRRQHPASHRPGPGGGRAASGHPPDGGATALPSAP
jgi:hypothetical protein